MDDYVSRKAVVNALTKVALRVADSHRRAIASCINEIELLPAANAVPEVRTNFVKSGWFDEWYDSYYTCQRCKKRVMIQNDSLDFFAPNVCPICGAKKD